MIKAIKSIASLTILVAAPVHATTYVFSGTLNGANEFPANASTATGSYNAVLDDAANSFFVNLSFSGLASNATAGLLHCCAPAGVNAPVILQLTGFPPTTSGTYSNTLFGLTSADVTGIKSGLSYIDIITPMSPAGEIQGQLVPAAVASVPEPATWAMMLLGFGFVGGILRRRQYTRTKLNLA